MRDQLLVDYPLPGSGHALFSREISVRTNCLGVHSDVQASFEPTIAATVPLVFVNDAVASKPTNVTILAGERATEEALAAVTRQNA